MSSSQVILLRKAVNNLSTDIAFKKRWVRCTSLLAALKCRYILKDVTLTKASISRVISKVEPDVMNLNFKHNSGIYSGINRQERYYWFQDAKNDPPMFPATINNKLVWDSIRSVDNKKLGLYIKRITHSKEKQRNTKRGRLGEIDIYDNITPTQGSASIPKKMPLECIKSNDLMTY